MGEYARLNRMLREHEERLTETKSQNAEAEDIADLYQSIGEIKGALLEMADIDGLDDPYEAFDYCEEYDQDEWVHPEHGRIVDVRHDPYHDVTIYEDGYEERFYIGE